LPLHRSTANNSGHASRLVRASSTPTHTGRLDVGQCSSMLGNTGG
jgi:hypothetical protein